MGGRHGPTESPCNLRNYCFPGLPDTSASPYLGKASKSQNLAKLQEIGSYSCQPPDSLDVNLILFFPEQETYRVEFNLLTLSFVLRPHELANCRLCIVFFPANGLSRP